RCSRSDRSINHQLLLQSAWQSRRREQLAKFAPTFLGIGAASFLDVMTHHVFPEIVIDHVTPVTLDEFHSLVSASWFHHRVFLQPLHRSAFIDLAVDQSS